MAAHSSRALSLIAVIVRVTMGFLTLLFSAKSFTSKLFDSGGQRSPLFLPSPQSVPFPATPLQNLLAYHVFSFVFLAHRSTLFVCHPFSRSHQMHAPANATTTTTTSTGTLMATLILNFPALLCLHKAYALHHPRIRVLVSM